jgi:hypothetical protein
MSKRYFVVRNVSAVKDGVQVAAEQYRGLLRRCSPAATLRQATGIVQGSR